MLDITHHPCHLPQPKSWSKSCNVHNTAWWLWRPRAICGKYGTKARAKVAFQDPTFWIWIGNSPGVATSFNNPRVRTTSVTLFEGGPSWFTPFLQINQPQQTSHRATRLSTTMTLCLLWCMLQSLMHHLGTVLITRQLHHLQQHGTKKLSLFLEVRIVFRCRESPTKKKRQILPLNNAFLKIMGWCFWIILEKKQFFNLSYFVEVNRVVKLQEAPPSQTSWSLASQRYHSCAESSLLPWRAQGRSHLTCLHCCKPKNKKKCFGLEISSNICPNFLCSNLDTLLSSTFFGIRRHDELQSVYYPYQVAVDSCFLLIPLQKFNSHPHLSMAVPFTHKIKFHYWAQVGWHECYYFKCCINSATQQTSQQLLAFPPFPPDLRQQDLHHTCRAKERNCENDA